MFFGAEMCRIWYIYIHDYIYIHNYILYIDMIIYTYIKLWVLANLKFPFQDQNSVHSV